MPPVLSTTVCDSHVADASVSLVVELNVSVSAENGLDDSRDAGNCRRLRPRSNFRSSRMVDHGLRLAARIEQTVR